MAHFLKKKYINQFTVYEKVLCIFSVADVSEKVKEVSTE